MGLLEPTLKDVSFGIEWFSALRWLNAKEFTVVMRMLAQSACNRVWTYSEPTDGGVTSDPQKLARIVGLSKSDLSRCSKIIDEFFYLEGGFYYPRKSWFSMYGGPQSRPPIPASVRSSVLQRDGFQCCYCGSRAGPFELDHVVPFSRGGHPTDQENLITACVSCNREKRDRTPEEWLK